MPWLNWSLKLHIRLRTISLLISTHNTQVYVQINAIFICVIVLDKMCFHMLNLCWFKHKNIFECFRCFWKVFCSSKIENFKNHFCPVLATQSRVSQVTCHSRELACQFWRLVRKWKVQSWGLHRDFRGSARDSLAGRPSSRKKHLENFSKFCLWVFWRLVLASWWRLILVTKIACSAKWAHFQHFSQKGVLICLSCTLCLFTFWSYFHLFNITVVIFKFFHQLVTIQSIFKERYGFCPLFFVFLSYCLFIMVFVFYLVFLYLLPVFGYLNVWCSHFCVVLIWSTLYCSYIWVIIVAHCYFLVISI